MTCAKITTGPRWRLLQEVIHNCLVHWVMFECQLDDSWKCIMCVFEPRANKENVQPVCTKHITLWECHLIYKKKKKKKFKMWWWTDWVLLMYLFFLLCPQWTDLVLSWYQSKTHALWVWGLDSAAVKCRNLGHGYTKCNPEYTMCQTMNKPKTHGGRCYKQIRVDKPRPANLSDRQTDRWITWGVKQVHSVVNYLKVLLLNSCCPLCPRANMDTIVRHKLYYVLIYHRTGLWETFRSDKKKKKNLSVSEGFTT